MADIGLFGTDRCFIYALLFNALFKEPISNFGDWLGAAAEPGGVSHLFADGSAAGFGGFLGNVK